MRKNQVYRLKKNQGSEWKPSWMKRFNGIQTEYGKVLDDCCHVTSVLIAFHSKNHVITNIKAYFKHKLF